MDFYINHTLKNFFGLPGNYEISYNYDIETNLYQITINGPSHLLLNIDNFEDELRNIVRNDFPDYENFTLMIDNNKLILTFKPMERVEYLLSKFFENLKQNSVIKDVIITKSSMKTESILLYTYNVKLIMNDEILIGKYRNITKRFDPYHLDEYMAGRQTRFSYEIKDLIFNVNEQILITIQTDLKKYLLNTYNKVIDNYSYLCDRIKYNLTDLISTNKLLKLNANLSVKICFKNNHFKENTREMYYNNIVLHNLHLLKSSAGGMTEKQLRSSMFMALTHYTPIKHLSEIFASRKFETPINRYKRGQKVLYGTGAKQGTEKSAYNQLQFPGIYTRLLTQSMASELICLSQSIDEISPDDGKESYGHTHVYFWFSLSLLKQQNYHIKPLTEDNGVVNDTTFTTDSLSKYLHLIKFGHDNELVFHDDIPIEFVEFIVVNDNRDKRYVENLLIEYNLNIPVYLQSSELYASLFGKQLLKHIDDDQYLNNSLPQLCYPPDMGDDEAAYTGDIAYINKRERMTKIPYNEEEKYVWNVTLANCGIDDKYDDENHDRIVKKMEDRMQELYFNDAPRPEPKFLPPFKYTPDYYK